MDKVDKPEDQTEPTSAPLVPGASHEPEAQPNTPTPDLPNPDADVVEDDTELDEAVDDITTKESDAVLAAEDAVAKAFEPEPAAQGWRAKLKNLFTRWWNNRKVRYLTLAGLGLLIVLLLALPVSRYFLLNNVGVRASASLTVVDESTMQPLKNVHVYLAGQSAVSGNDGKVSIKHLKLGKTQLRIERRAFAEVNRKMTVGWGSNPLQDARLKPTGSRYTFTVNDFLSAKAIFKATASSGQADANANQKGQIVLTIDPSDASDPLEVKIAAEGYRTETVTINPDDKMAHNVAMVPAQKHVFVSRRAGKYDLYSIYADGKDQKMLLAATGAERSDIAVVQNPTNNLVALVSTRDNLHDNQGYLMSTLSIIDSSTGQNTAVTTSQRIQIMGWMGQRLIYIQIAAGASAANPKRQRLVSYDSTNNQKTELATSNYFNDVSLADNAVYYAPSDSYRAGTVGLYKVSPDGKDRQSLYTKQVWGLYRDKYDHYNVAVEDNNWLQFSLGSSQLTKTTTPANQQRRLFQDSPDGKHSLWVDNRDGKGVLLDYDVTKKAEKVLVTQSGLQLPLNWVGNNNVTYRVRTDQQTADYILSLDGGVAKKITDVTDVNGVTGWYYY